MNLFQMNAKHLGETFLENWSPFLLPPKSTWAFPEEFSTFIFYFQIITVLILLVCHCVCPVLWGAVINSLVADSCIKMFNTWLWLVLLFLLLEEGDRNSYYSYFRMCIYNFWCSKLWRLKQINLTVYSWIWFGTP